MSNKNQNDGRRPRVIEEGVEYPLVSGETTKLVWNPTPRAMEPEYVAGAQPWYSETLHWYFDRQGTSGPGMEDNPRRIDWEKVPA